MPSNGFSLELPIGKVSKVKDHHGDSIYSVDELGSFEGSFAIAHSKKELGAALDEMNDAGAFSDFELDDAALAALMGMGGEQQMHYKGDC